MSKCKRWFKNKIDILSKQNNLHFIYPAKKLYCMDNAAMIWVLAYYKIKYSQI